VNRAGLTLALLLMLAAGFPGAAATEQRADTSTAAFDSIAASPSAVLIARLAYQNAWAQRQAGNPDAAARIANEALDQVKAALKSNPPQSVRADLTELQSRLSGLRGASLHDRDEAAAAKKSGNEPDEKVLNTPAKDEIEPQINAQVLRYIQFFTGSGRSTFERWLKRSGRYMELFRQALQKEVLPPDLVHLVFVESGFNVNARSVSAAVGPWQFLRGTARLFGLTVNQWVDERKDPEKSTIAAARYLKHLYTIFGDWPLALASYNAGEGTVLRAIKKQGTTNYWDLRLPRQTEDYVPQFMAILAISRDPDKYGFDDVILDDPMEFDEVALQGGVDLRAVARMADCTYSELKLLNPAVLSHAASGSNGVTSIRVPRGKGEALMHKLQSGVKLPLVDLSVRHRVRRRETLNSIAADYHVSAKQLALTNGIGRKRPLRRGMMLVVPASLGAPAIAVLEDGDPRASTAYVPSRRTAPRPIVRGNSEAGGRTLHTVRRGETLAEIAQRYNVSVSDLRRWNRLNSSSVRRGTRLKIRTAEAMGRPGTNDAATSQAIEPHGDVKATDAKDRDTPVNESKSGDAKDHAAKSSNGTTSDAKASGAKHRDTKPSGAKPSLAKNRHTQAGAPKSSLAGNRRNRGTRSRSPEAIDATVASAGGAAVTNVAAVSTAKPPAGAVVTSAAAPATRVIVVHRGDTLGSLAQALGVSVRQIMALNGLKSPHIRPGQKLRVPTSTTS
jgi:membrane-bound lytic murein transglycosylase D